MATCCVTSANGFVLTPEQDIYIFKDTCFTLNVLKTKLQSLDTTIMLLDGKIFKTKFSFTVKSIVKKMIPLADSALFYKSHEGYFIYRFPYLKALSTHHVAEIENKLGISSPKRGSLK